MKALVTGATGFVGSYLVPELLRRGDEVAALVRPARAARQLERQGVRVVRVDLRRANELPELADADVVYHLAAGVVGGWRGTFETNVTATENLVSTIRATGWRGRFVHASSFSVYGLNQLRPGAAVDETTPLEPTPGRRDDYAWSKLWQERVLEPLADADRAQLVIVRPGEIYGRERQLPYRVGRQIGDRVVLLMGGGNVMPLTYVENTASLIALCGRDERAGGEIFNCVDPEPITQRQFLRHWLRAHPGTVVLPVPLALTRAVGALLLRLERRSDGRLGPPAFLDPYVAEPNFRRFSFESSRPAKLLGWRSPVRLREALRRTFDEG